MKYKCFECKYYMKIEFDYEDKVKVFCLKNREAFKDMVLGQWERESPKIIECNQHEKNNT